MPATVPSTLCTSDARTCRAHRCTSRRPAPLLGGRTARSASAVACFSNNSQGEPRGVVRPLRPAARWPLAGTLRVRNIVARDPQDPNRNAQIPAAVRASSTDTPPLASFAKAPALAATSRPLSGLELRSVISTPSCSRTCASMRLHEPIEAVRDPLAPTLPRRLRRSGRHEQARAGSRTPRPRRPRSGPAARSILRAGSRRIFGPDNRASVRCAAESADCHHRFNGQQLPARAADVSTLSWPSGSSASASPRSASPSASYFATGRNAPTGRAHLLGQPLFKPARQTAGIGRALHRRDTAPRPRAVNGPSQM